MARRRRSLADRYRPQAQLEAQLQTAPEYAALREVLSQARGARDTSIDAARATGRGLRDTIAAVRPDVAGNYETAGARLGAQQAAVTPRLDQLGPAADLIRAAAIAEAGAAQTALTTAGTRNLADLDMQRVRAAEGSAFAVQQAGSRYQSDLGKIAERLQDLGSREGMITASTLNKLVDGARGRSIQRDRIRVSDENADARLEESKRARRDRENARNAPKKPKWATPQQQGAAQDKINTGIAAIKPIAEKLPRDKAAKVLLAGDPASGIPRMTPLYASIALDIAYDGHISQRNVKELHKRRIKVRPLGFPTRPKTYTDRVNAGEVAGPAIPGA